MDTHSRTLSELARARLIENTEGAWVEADLLFPRFRGREVGKFSASMVGWYQLVLNSRYVNFESQEDFADSYPDTYSYLMNYRNLLTERSTYKRYMRGLPIYSIYCVGDYSFSSYKVVWPEQQNPNEFRASVVSCSSSHTILPNCVIVPDHKLYFGLESIQGILFMWIFKL